MSKNIDKLLYKVLKEYSVLITYTTIEQEIKTHPDYPSMQTISDALNSWKIKHVIIKLTLEKLRMLDVPVLAFMNNSEYVWVRMVTESEVYFWNTSGKKKNVSSEHFEQKWSGVALAIENINDAGEPNYKEVHQKEIKEKIFKYFITGSFIFILAFLAFCSWINETNLSLFSKALLLFTNSIGCYISYILIRQEKNYSDSLSEKFCKIGKYVDCKQVTTSKYSSFFGLISWAELGATYFSSILLWVVIAPLSSNWFPSLCLLSFIVLPFTLWSLFTQALVIRKWCLFCCSIVFLLWVNASILYFSYSLPTMGSIPDAGLMALLFITCLVAVIKISKTYSKEHYYEQKRIIAKIKYNKLTIQAQLSKQVLTIDNIGFTFGNLNSSNDIGFYISASCMYCGKAVKELKMLTEIYPDFRYRLIFTVSSDKYDDISNTIIRHFICLYKTMDKNDFLNALVGWYKMPEKNPETFQKAFTVPSTQDCKSEIEALYQFNQQSKIIYTPTILLNGQQLSQIYSYKDISCIARAIYTEK